MSDKYYDTDYDKHHFFNKNGICCNNRECHKHMCNDKCRHGESISHMLLSKGTKILLKGGKVITLGGESIIMHKEDFDLLEINSDMNVSERYDLDELYKKEKA